VSPVAQLGSEDRPLTLAFVLPIDDRDTQTAAAANDLETWLLGELGVTVSVTFVNNDSEALRAICSETEDASPTAAWVSAFTVMAAESACGAEPVMGIVRGTGTRAAVGTAVELVGRAGLAALDALRGQAICRVAGEDDLSTWIYPTLLLTGAGVNPFTDMPAPREYESAADVVRAIYDGDCPAAALPPDVYDDALDDLESSLTGVSREQIEAAFTILRPAGDPAPPRGASWSGYDTNVIPYDALVFPPSSVLPNELREQIVAALSEHAESRDGRDLLDTVLDASAVIAVDAGDFGAFRAVVNQANWDMTFAG
jgi:ABC-type phosphate/phosphonate transport system substrate-binding protein